jgi:hypothetical protein
MSRFFALSKSTIEAIACSQHHLMDYYIGKLDSLDCGRHLETVFPQGPLGCVDFAYAYTLGPEAARAVSDLHDCGYDIREALDELETRRFPN